MANAETNVVQKRSMGLLLEMWNRISKQVFGWLGTINRKKAVRIKRLLVPFDVGHCKARLGNDADGGYVLSLDVLRSVEKVYSLGISNDCQIDLLLANQGKFVYQYDKNPCATPSHPNMRFKQLFMDATALRRELNEESSLENGANLLLMDIEGGEYDIVLNSGDLLRHFSQICLELHSVLSNSSVEKLLGRLNETHVLIHIHANNWVRWPGYKRYTGHSGILHGLPDLLELTYVRRDTFQNTKVWDTKSPTPLDKKNIGHFKDVELDWWCC